MSSPSGDIARQPERLGVEDVAVDQLSDVGSFSRTRPDVEDDDDELDSSPPPEEAEEVDGIALAANGTTIGNGIASPVEVSIQVCHQAFLLN
jgi:hypothetical protein